MRWLLAPGFLVGTATAVGAAASSLGAYDGLAHITSAAFSAAAAFGVATTSRPWRSIVVAVLLAYPALGAGFGLLPGRDAWSETIRLATTQVVLPVAVLAAGGMAASAQVCLSGAARVRRWGLLAYVASALAWMPFVGGYPVSRGAAVFGLALGLSQWAALLAARAAGARIDAITSVKSGTEPPA